MGMSAKDAYRAPRFGRRQGAGRNFFAQPQPARVPLVQQLRQPLAPAPQFLDQQVDVAAEADERQPVLDHKTIELMAVNREMTPPGLFPNVFPVGAHTHQMRHHVDQAAIVIPFHPHHLDPPLGVRQLADIGKKPPVLLLEPAEIQVAENVAQQDEPAERKPLQHFQRLGGTRGFRPQMQVGEDHGIVSSLFHAPLWLQFKVAIELTAYELSVNPR